MRDNPSPPYLRHTAWSGILQRFFALALVWCNRGCGRRICQRQHWHYFLIHISVLPKLCTYEYL